MSHAYTLPTAQRAAVIDSIRRSVASEGALGNTPDDLLLVVLHALTGRTADMVRHVTATARRWAD